jgi:hypothetical protein
MNPEKRQDSGTYDCAIEQLHTWNMPNSAQFQAGSRFPLRQNEDKHRQAKDKHRQAKDKTWSYC